MEQEINEWINCNDKHRSSKWLECDKMLMYVRWCKVKGLDAMVIATVEVKEEYRRQGIFKHTLDYWEGLAKLYDRIVVVEHVQNPVLLAYLLERRGYYIIEEDSCAKTIL